MPGLKLSNLSLISLYSSIKHYFPNLNNVFNEMNDFRQIGKVKYDIKTMMWMGIQERILGFQSNNEFELALQASSEIENNISHFIGEEINELPSIDAMCYFYQHINPKEIHEVRKKMLNTLERKKFLEQFKTDDGYLLLAIDGVQTFSTSREIGHSITRKHDNKSVTRHQYFLEAKVVSKQGFVISIDTEPIENPIEEFDKQDCEQKAAVRLLQRISKEHPHMKFWILGDGLYCHSKLMDICEKNSRKYSFTFTGKTKYPKLLEEINCKYSYSQRNNHYTHLLRRTETSELYIELRWCNNVEYDLGNNGERNINFIEGRIVRKKKGVTKVVTEFSFLVDSPTSRKNAYKKLMDCRRRWKIENEGFNFQKNNILNIGHSFSSVGYAAQNFYLLAQIAHTIIQLTSLTDIAGQVRRVMTGDTDTLSQSLKSIFKISKMIAQRMRVELFDKVFKPPLICSMRVRLKLA